MISFDCKKKKKKMAVGGGSAGNFRFSSPGSFDPQKGVEFEPLDCKDTGTVHAIVFGSIEYSSMKCRGESTHIRFRSTNALLLDLNSLGGQSLNTIDRCREDKPRFYDMTSTPLTSVSFSPPTSPSLLTVSSVFGGVRIYSLSPFSPTPSLVLPSLGSCSVAEMVGQTSLLAVVGSGPESSPKELRLYNTSALAASSSSSSSFSSSSSLLTGGVGNVSGGNSGIPGEICSLSLSSTILRVLLSRTRLVVILRNRLHIFDLASLKILRTIESENPHGIGALSQESCSGECLLAFPKSPQSGDVIIFDATHLHPLAVIKAHKNPISTMVFSDTGLLATASERGTLIRVFRMPLGEPVAEFRRGSLGANIYSLNFGPNGDLLAVTSGTGTVHVYKIPNTSGSASSSSSSSFWSSIVGGGNSSGSGNNSNAHAPMDSEDQTGSTGPSSSTSGGSGASAVAGFVGGLMDLLPTSQARDYCRARIPPALAQFYHTAVFSSDETKIFVASLEGSLLVYSLPSSAGAVSGEQGMDCHLVQEWDLRS